MASRVYEIVELTDGEYILQRVDRDEEPLVRIKFSDDASDFLSDARTTIAKVMIEAGLNEVEDMVDEELSHRGDAIADLDTDSNTIH